MHNFTQVLTESHHLFKPIVPELWQLSKIKLINFDDIFWQQLYKKSQRGLPCWPDIILKQEQENVELFVGGHNTIRKNMYGVNKNHIHLGMDLVLPVDTDVYTPLPARVYKIMSCSQQYDYGTTIILEHNIDSTIFYTLYAHLSPDTYVKSGEFIKEGIQIGSIGSETQNSGWPPHLHFQILSSELVINQFYQGVVEPDLASLILPHCPNPNLILQLEIHS